MPGAGRVENAVDRPAGDGRTRRVLFVRHGETAYNRRQLRCGGDVDIPLTDHGEGQARAVGERLRSAPDPIDAIIASPLQRTLRTAELIRESLGGPPVPLFLHPGLIERRLGAWNGRDVAATQPLLDAGLPPPGGEAEEAFRARVRDCLADIVARGHRLPLLVASKGVGRVLGLLTGSDRRQPIANSELVAFAVGDDGP